MSILLIEDNPRLSELVASGLEAEGFPTDCFTSVADAEAVVKDTHYDLILLDLGLPDGDGLDLLKKWKMRASVSTPVLVITARDGLDDKVLGLDAGADDYLVKPFAMPELLARCRALLRRPENCLGTVLAAGNITLNVSNKEVRIAGKTVEMPLREYGLLDLLMRRMGQVITKSGLEASLYAMHAEVTPNALEATVSRLRKRLTQANADLFLHTAHGIGYALFAKEN